MPDRAAAQQRADQVQAFRRELHALAAAGVSPLTAEQQQAIRIYHDSLLAQLSARYDIDRDARAGQLSRGMRIAAFFAAATLTAAIYALVARFWGRLDMPLQATLLCLAPLGALIGVELAARRERTLYVASIFALVAYGAIWLAIIELSRTLDVPLVPASVWAAGLFGVALALAYGFQVLLGLSLFALVVALAGSLFQVAGSPWPALVEFPEIVLLVGFAVSALAPSLGRAHRPFAAVTRLVGLGVAMLALLMLGGWPQTSLIPAPDHAVAVLYQVLTVLVCVIVLVLAIRNRWNESVGLASIVLTLFLLSRFVEWFWDRIPRYLFFLVLAVLAFGWLFALRRVRARLERR